MDFSGLYKFLSQSNLVFNGSESSKEIISKICLQNFNDIDFILDHKCDKESAKTRERGNNMLTEKFDFENLKEIHKIYTKALFQANSFVELAYSYGNRSTVLFKIGLYNLCINDIDRAIEFGYPKSKIYKLFVRKAESFLMLKDFIKAANSFTESLSFLTDNIANLSSWKKRIENGLRCCQIKEINKEFNVSVSILSSYPTYIELFNSNPNVLSMSDKVYLKVNKEDGRGIFAKTEIAIGDVLAVENPYSYRISAECFLTHCYYCVRYNLALKPCPGCNMVGYCNDLCESNARSKMRHDLECGALSQILSTKSKELGLLAYGVVILNSFDVIFDILNKVESPNFNISHEIVDSCSYLSAVTIETNEQLREFKDLVDRCTSSVFLALCLQKMLKRSGETVTGENWIFTITQAFCKHLQGLPCNAHSLSELSVPLQGNLELSSVDYVGNALYNALSLVNHSCCPNVVRITMGRGQCILKAISPIKAHEQIYDNYSYHFATSSLKNRKENLKDQYYFDCQCVPCKEDWPSFEKLLQSPKDTEFICILCRQKITISTFACFSCQISIEDKYKRFLVLQSSISDKMKQLLQRKFDEVENYLLEFLSLLHAIVKCPNILFNQTTEMIKLIWSLRGSTWSFS